MGVGGVGVIGGATGAGGAGMLPGAGGNVVGAGGGFGAGGISSTGTGGFGQPGNGGGIGTGGVLGAGGSPGAGGVLGAGGSPGAGGAIGTGGVLGAGGAIGTGGAGQSQCPTTVGVPGSVRSPTRKIKILTGTATSSGQFGVGGTDLGIPVRQPNGKIAYIFGDTFDQDQAAGPGWRAPVLLRSEPGLSANGIVFNGAAGGQYAKQILPYAHTNLTTSAPRCLNRKATLVPTAQATARASPTIMPETVPLRRELEQRSRSRPFHLPAAL